MLRAGSQTSESPARNATQNDSCVENWEAAYLRFETPDEEVDKFRSRLLKVGAASWPRDISILELFCGRGNGLRALSSIGFTRIEGLDLSGSLLARYAGPAQCYMGDARQLPFDALCKDLVIVQGGLHHLESLPDDLEQVLSESNRVLRNEGRVVIVEPWSTPFLSFAHTLCRSRLARSISPKIDALATMIRYEQKAYEQWLSNPQIVLSVLEKYFFTQQQVIAWGKLVFVGRKRTVV